MGPLSGLIDEWFSNDEAMKYVQSACMIVHGQKDTLIPWAHGEALYKICPTRKVFVNPLTMEHNTNLTTDVSHLIVPMFRFFALPDYSFDDIKVPAWAFDKRCSPLYVRPEVQVCSHKPVTDFGAKEPGAHSTHWANSSVTCGVVLDLHFSHSRSPQT